LGGLGGKRQRSETEENWGRVERLAHQKGVKPQGFSKIWGKGKGKQVLKKKKNEGGGNHRIPCGERVREEAEDNITQRGDKIEYEHAIKGGRRKAQVCKHPLKIDLRRGGRQRGVGVQRISGRKKKIK